MNIAAHTAYPENPTGRDRWIMERRGARQPVDPDKPYAYLVEQERFANGEIGFVATIFLTNRECPWRCVMCDLWRNTLTASVATGSIPRQIEYALERLPAARQIKLYNSGSFFDPRAIPFEDYTAIASLVNGFERVIVESHPSLIGESCFAFAHKLKCDFEIAMGLETAHPAVLEKLNKRMTLDQYSSAAARLKAANISLRSFILVQPPFMDPADSLEWACRSVDFAISCGASVMTLIPTRAGNGAMEQLIVNQQFTPPDLRMVEEAMDYGLSRNRARVFVDLWDINQVQAKNCCREARVARLTKINLSQSSRPQVLCDQCDRFA